MEFDTTDFSPAAMRARFRRESAEAAAALRRRRRRRPPALGARPRRARPGERLPRRGVPRRDAVRRGHDVPRAVAAVARRAVRVPRRRARLRLLQAQRHGGRSPAAGLLPRPTHPAQVG